MALMCQGRIDFESLQAAQLVSVPEHFAAEMRALAPFVDAGLVQVDDEAIEVTATGICSAAPRVAPPAPIATSISLSCIPANYRQDLPG